MAKGGTRARGGRHHDLDVDEDLRSTTSSHDEGTVDSHTSAASGGVAAAAVATGVGGAAGRRSSKGSRKGNHHLPEAEEGDEEGGFAAVVDPLGEALDKLTEKRSTTRLEGLTAMLKQLQTAVDPDPILAKRETITEGVLGCLRRPTSASEAQIAMQAAAALAVCVGPQEDELYRQLAKLLTTAITRSKDAATRVEACRALAMACFVCCSDADANDMALEVLSSVFTRTSEGMEVTDDVAAAALRGWCLLATAGPKEWLGGPAVEALLPAVKELLSSGSVDAREAAGEAAALMREASDALHAAQAEAGAEAADEYGEVDAMWDEIGTVMQAYATETSKKMSKDAKKVQRRHFRDLHAAVAEGAAPPWQELSLQTCSVEINTWADSIRLEALRACLHGGLQVQAQHNPTVRELLGAVDGGAGGGGVLDKSGGTRKWRSEARAHDRHVRQSAKDAFLWEDEA